MSDDEDDYLSDKFLSGLVESSQPKTKTYSDLRKEATRKSQLKNEQNRTKSRRQREEEAREEGLSKSLFERAEEEEAAGASGNKALAMMMKMGFKPGQSLGHTDSLTTGRKAVDESEPLEPGSEVDSKLAHRSEPLPLNEWTGNHFPFENLKRLF
jgi:hypothetical protein